MDDGLTKELRDLGLDSDEIHRHAERIQSVVRGGHTPVFRIADTCRLDNFGILPANWLDEAADSNSSQPFVAFVPAAGAASRYVAPFAALAEGLRSGNESAVKAATAKLREDGALKWGLPSHVRRLLEAPETPQLSAEETAALLTELTLPKALMPCTQDGVSFLALKCYEHETLASLQGQVFVTPPHWEADFRQTLPTSTRLRSEFLPQGMSMSTLRFDAEGQPVREPDGHLSTVPAGHGTLVSLFPQVGQDFPGARALFIRNIDNVMGTGPEARTATDRFLQSYASLLESITRIRTALARDDLATAAAEAQSLAGRSRRAPLHENVRAEIRRYPSQEAPLWEIIFTLFQMPPQQLTHFRFNRSSRQTLQAIFDRPLNILGQVPNDGKDVGGTPVFVETSLGLQKVCLELPHASAADVENFLANPRKATHFNPVFVCAEIISNPRTYDDAAQPFWILASKTYRGKPVYYHEMVLYELLGNNLLANALFVEVPRLIFHPHKTPADSAGKTLSHWVSQ